MEQRCFTREVHMHRSTLHIGMMLAVGLLWLAGTAAHASTEVAVTLNEFKVELANSTLPAGEPVTFVMTNNGKLAHEIVFERAGAVDEPIESGGVALEAEDILPGTTRRVVWTIPAAGEYQFACHIPGHFEAGMKAVFNATAPAPTTPAAAPRQLPRTAGLDRTRLGAGRRPRRAAGARAGVGDSRPPGIARRPPLQRPATTLSGDSGFRRARNPRMLHSVYRWIPCR